MTWTHQKIRRTFLDYFKNHQLNHEEVSGSPLIPRDDPTLLFCNAGMNQFKSALLGEEKREYQRATSVQPCVRAGGKHNDLDNVGKNGRHLTWFEMLGNWSFGNYGKRDTIKMAWDLSVNVLGLDVSRLYVSVYKDDDESYQIWHDEIGVEASHIYRFGDLEQGDDENFWSMGPVGPCGPCTELFYDLGPEAGESEDDVMGGEGDRYMEFWNNVFMQYNRDDLGTLTSLPALSVDTGMGLERIVMILQGKLSVFDTDIFQPLIQKTAALINANPQDAQQKIDLQVIADHIRTLTFVISEGGRFSNEGRGYVLRRILRRAVRHGRRLGFDAPFLWRIVPMVADTFEGVYELPHNILEHTALTLKEEEARFFQTIDRGMGRIHAMMDTHQQARSTVITGQEAFELYDTFGFPVDLTEIEAQERGFSVDLPGFEEAMQAQRERSRKSARFYEDDGGEWISLRDGGGQGFAGYNLTEYDVEVMRYRQDAQRVELIFEQTPFYAESGGEVADRGEILVFNQVHDLLYKLEITDVQKVNGIIHHIASCDESIVIDRTMECKAYVDVAYRNQKRVHHTATHLLHAALKTILGAHVEQKGSVVEAQRLRFDFSHTQALSSDELLLVTQWVNSRIRLNEAVDIQGDVPLETARERGAMALFGEKYGSHVRTIQAGGDSYELCGGNHVQRTGDIGSFLVISESAVAAGVRRIEAVVAEAADMKVAYDRQCLSNIMQSLKSDQSRVVERVSALQDEIKQLKKALTKARKEGGGVNIEQVLKQAVKVGDTDLIATQVEVADRNALSALMDSIRERRPHAVCLLMSVDDSGEKVMISAGIGHELKKDRRFNAGKLMKSIAPLVGGKGGGRPDFANGAGSAVDQIPDALAQAPQVLSDLLA